VSVLLVMKLKNHLDSRSLASVDIGGDFYVVDVLSDDMVFSGNSRSTWTRILRIHYLSCSP
jgi:hypothetical protein